MKKGILIGGCLLLLCCCFSVIVGFALIGHFESNNACVYRGPFSSVSTGVCAKSTVTTTTTNSQNTDNNTENTANTKTYTSTDFTFEYPMTFTVDDSDSERLFVYAENGTDNLNMSTKDLEIFASQTNCQEYGDAVINELSDYDASIVDVNLITINGAYACQIDFSADYGTDIGVLNQTQYYVEDGSKTHILTITVDANSTNFDDLEQVVQSFTLR